jgi:hypothetical protein
MRWRSRIQQVRACADINAAVCLASHNETAGTSTWCFAPGGHKPEAAARSDHVLIHIQRSSWLLTLSVLIEAKCCGAAGLHH